MLSVSDKRQNIVDHSLHPVVRHDIAQRCKALGSGIPYHCEGTSQSVDDRQKERAELYAQGWVELWCDETQTGEAIDEALSSGRVFSIFILCGAD